jgi:Phytochelatin synthase
LFQQGASIRARAAMELKTKAWTAAVATALISIVLAVAGVEAVLSRTKVSPEAIQSSVIHADDAVEQAWKLPAAASFRHEVSWQSNASLCGPSSLANVFRSFGENVTSESSVLAGTGLCWSGYCIMGLTLDELAELARAKTRRNVTVLRDMSAEEFRENLKRSNEPANRYIINFDRKMIFGAGSGHHSPIGGYLENDDLVFVLDVNREYRPWLVKRTRLFDAMNTWDGDKKRGMLLIE